LENYHRDVEILKNLYLFDKYGHLVWNVEERTKVTFFKDRMSVTVASLPFNPLI